MPRTPPREPAGTPRRRLLSLGIVAVALLAAVPALTAAEPGRIVLPSEGTSLVPGEVTTVRWETLPRGIEEMELLLSLDGGASFPLRLTPQLAPGLQGYQWRVPPLPSATVRLRLRFQIGGEEAEGPPSAVFGIAPATSRAPAPVTRYAGEWWIGPGGAPVSLHSSLGDPADPEVEEQVRRVHALAPQGQPLLPPPARGGGVPVPRSNESGADAAGLVCTASLRGVPLRR